MKTHIRTYMNLRKIQSFSLPLLIFNWLKPSLIKDCPYYFKGMYAPIYDNAEKVDLNKCYVIEIQQENWG